MRPNNSDPRYRINIEPGMRVMIVVDDNPELIACYVKEILTGDPKHESGIKVLCEDGKVGRVRYIGTESVFKKPMELVMILEKQIRMLIVDILSKHNPNWWNANIPSLVREAVEEKQKRGTETKQRLGIPEYDKIKETDFFHLHLIVGYKKNWSTYFEDVFKDKSETMNKLKDLASYRNLTVHGKDLTDDMVKNIQVHFDDMIRSVEDYYRKNAQNTQ